MDQTVRHPGDILVEDYLDPLEISPNQLARDTALNPSRIYNIVNGTNGITADTALRIGRFFETIPPSSIPTGHRPADPKWWLGLQNDYDLSYSAASTDWAEVKSRILQYRRAAVPAVSQQLLPFATSKRGAGRRARRTA